VIVFEKMIFGRSTMRDYGRDFSQAVRTALAKQGIAVIGGHLVPNATTGQWIDPELCYLLDDRGTCKLRTYSGVLAMATATMLKGKKVAA
jgi:hypothetical protein